MARILIVEDDGTLGMTLEMSLESAGHTVNWCTSCATAREALNGESPELVVLDLGLPDGDGMDLCQELRTRGVLAPILILTARGTLEARVEGLTVGADDYVTKPFELPELMARIEALLRREGWHKPSDVVRIGLLDVDFGLREASKAGEAVPLTQLEVKLLHYLVQKVGQVVSRQDLLNDVWGVDPSTRTRTIDVFIGRLRRIIEPEPATPRHLLNVRGVGYRLRL